MIKSIKGRYLTEPGFEKLSLLTLSEEHRTVRSYAKRVRNHAAFHLDEYDESTRRTLVGLALFLGSDESGGCTGANFIVDAGLTQN